MKRLLLLAYHFPPRATTGSLRAVNLAKYLGRFGWEVTVVTARFLAGHPPNWANVVETDYTDVVGRTKRFLAVPQDRSAHEILGSASPKVGSRMTIKQRFVELCYKVITFPDPQKGWLGHGVRATNQLLRDGKFDALMSTSYPYTAHMIAARSVKGKDIPWLADLRDAWRDNHYNEIPGLQYLNALAERRTLSRATFISTVSAPLSDVLRKNNPHVPVYDIPNSFDPDDWASVPFRKPTKFTLTYAGSLLQGHRDPEPLFDALLDEIHAGRIRRDEVEILFYTRPESWLEAAVEGRGLRDIVSLRGYVEREAVLAAERSTTANLLLLRDHPGEEGVYTGKLFEYLGARRPILVIGGPRRSVVRDLLDRTGGWYARTRGEIRAALTTLYNMHTAASDVLLDESVTSQYSAVAMAHRFAEVLSTSANG